MNYRKKKLKALVFSVGLVLGVMTPVIAQTQFGGGVLGYGPNTDQQSREGLFYNSTNQEGYNIGTEIFGSDTDGGFNIYTQQFGYDEPETPLGSGFIVLTLAGAAYAIRKRKNNKKTINKMKSANTFIIAAVLLLGLSQCKKQEVPDTPVTPEVEGDQVYISVSVNGGSKHIVYPESGVYFFQDGDKLYVGNHGYYVGTLAYSAGVFSGTIEIADTCAAAIEDYLHFYFIGGAYTGDLKTQSATDPTRSFEWSIADQTGDKLPILSYGHSTQKYSRKATAYSCMLENKCGLLKFRAWPAPSTTTDYDTVKISLMKTTARIDFENPGITPTDAIGDVKLHHVSGTDAAERWAILLPQEGHETTVSYYKNNDNGNPPSLYTQTISLPVIKANTYYGGYNGISVGLEYVDLGLSVLWAACNVGSCTPEGYGKFFAWGDPHPKTAYCWSHYPYAQDPDPYDGDTIHYEWDSTVINPEGNIKLKPNLWLTKYNTITEDEGGTWGTTVDNKTTLDLEDDAAHVNWGNGWRTPTKAEWEELITGTTQTRVEVNGVGGIRYISKVNGNSIFLPFAGSYSGTLHLNYHHSGNQPQGQYWSNKIDSGYPYRAYILYFEDPNYTNEPFSEEYGWGTVASTITFFTDPMEYARYQGRPVRAVRDK